MEAAAVATSAGVCEDAILRVLSRSVQERLEILKLGSRM